MTKDNLIALRVTDEMKADLKRAAEAEGVSISEVIRHAVELYLRLVQPTNDKPAE